MTEKKSFLGYFNNSTARSIAIAVVVAIIGISMAGTITRGQANQFTSMLLLMTLGSNDE